MEYARLELKDLPNNLPKMYHGTSIELSARMVIFTKLSRNTLNMPLPIILTQQGSLW